MFNPIIPDRNQFSQDPGGYSRSAWMRWAFLVAANGGDADPDKPPTSRDLKSPILWLAQAEAMTPVSYTHLDVYKRQVIGGAGGKAQCGDDRHAERTCHRQMLLGHEPVSYTHLDVYKRQFDRKLPSCGTHSTKG